MTLANKVSTSGVRCFGCGKTNHPQVDYKKQGKKVLFVDLEDYEMEDAYVGEEPVFNSINKQDEDILERDTGPTLVVKQMCLHLVQTRMSSYATTSFSPHVPSMKRYATLSLMPLVVKT